MVGTSRRALMLSLAALLSCGVRGGEAAASLETTYFRLAIGGDGRALSIGELQLEGQKRLNAPDFLRGHPIPAGSRLVNRMGTRQAKMGKIVIETTHPTMKTVPIRVKFAVE